MGIKNLQFAKTKGEKIDSPYEYTQVVTLDSATMIRRPALSCLFLC